jgi:hypothetical protein
MQPRMAPRCRPLILLLVHRSFGNDIQLCNCLLPLEYSKQLNKRQSVKSILFGNLLGNQVYA